MLRLDSYVTRDGIVWDRPLPRCDLNYPIAMLVEPLFTPPFHQWTQEQLERDELQLEYREYHRVPLRLELGPLLLALPDVPAERRVQTAVRILIAALERQCAEPGEEEP